jgi:hypothetical protein
MQESSRYDLLIIIMRIDPNVLVMKIFAHFLGGLEVRFAWVCCERCGRAKDMSNTSTNCLFLLPKEEINSREDGGMLYSRTHTHTLDARTCFPVLSLLCRQVNLISPRDLDAITPPTPGRSTPLPAQTQAHSFM